jgi:preprotein translocase subunit SecY
MSLLSALAQAMRIPELRRKLLFTLGILLAFRMLAGISIPGADPVALNKLFNGNALLGLLNLFSGGGLQTFSVVGEGLNPYINATIIMQLMTVVSLRLKELAKEGEQGRKKITRYTRWLTVPLAAMQAFGLVNLFSSQSAQVLNNPSTAATIGIIITLTAGTVILMWFGELITEYGVGNGVSLIIFAGIIGRAGSYVQTLQAVGASNGFFVVVFFLIIAVAVTAMIIYVQQAQRKIPVQSAQRVLNPRTGLASQGRRNFLPLRVNTAGVIPIIFAISIMFFPTIFANFFGTIGGTVGSMAQWIQANWSPTGPFPINLVYNGFEFLLIFGFTYFYTSVVFDPVDAADNLKKSSTFIPGIRPGRSTAEYLGKVMARITFAGAMFLAFITVVLPLGTALLLHLSNPSQLYLGGTAVLIVVGVALDTMKQIETQLMMRQYRGFIR